MALRCLKWRLERLLAEEFWLVETRDLRARRSTCKDRGWELKVMRRTVPVEAENEARVARRPAVRRRAWFRRRQGSSRVNESLRGTAMLLEQ